MYCEYFGLKRFPFSLITDLRFLQASDGADQMFRQIIGLINQNAELIEIIAEPGMGKSMLFRRLVRALQCHQTRYIPVCLAHPAGKMQCLLTVLTVLNPHSPEPENAAAALRLVKQELVDQATSGRRIVLLVDESQAMSDSSKKLLLQLLPGTGEAFNLQLVLFGHQGIAEGSTGMAEALSGRQCHRLSLPAISPSQLESYVMGRLHQAGYRGSQLLDPRALAALHQGSRGIPRLINILVHKALMHACAADENRLTAAHISAAINETESVG